MKKIADDFETETDELTNEAAQAERAASPSIEDRFSGASDRVKSDLLANILRSAAIGGGIGAARGVRHNASTHDTLAETGAGAALGGLIGTPIASLISAAQGFHNPSTKSAGFADGLISKYVLPRVGLLARNTGANLKWMGQQAGRIFGGAKPPTLAATNAPYNAQYRALQGTFDALPMPKQIAYGAAKRGVGYATGTAVGAGTAASAINGFSGAIQDKKNEEIGKAIGTARSTIQTAMSDPATRLKLGLGAIFAPGTANAQIDELLNRIQANATAQ